MLQCSKQAQPSSVTLFALGFVCMCVTDCFIKKKPETLINSFAGLKELYFAQQNICGEYSDLGGVCLPCLC